MANHNMPFRQKTLGIVSLLSFLATSVAAAPMIQQTSGTFNHKNTVTITGSGFGSKATAAPVVWDDASGTNILNKWDLAWPNTNSAYNMAYRSPQRGIALPHNNITKYLAGAHGGSGANGGQCVMVWKNRTISSYPAYTYASWYQRADDAWVFGSDDNYKVFDFSRGNGGYDLPNNWYLEYNPRPTSRTSTTGWHLLDDSGYPKGASLSSPDNNGHSWWWNGAVNPMGGQWAKVEVEIKYTNQSNGYIKLWENGVLKVNYAGKTDGYSGTERSEGIGGYARIYNQPNNWRYFADAYLDYTLARVVLANNADLSQATIIETQIPSSWSSNSINVSVNLGKFSTRQTAYLFVFDSSGAHNATGFPVTVGSTTDQATLSAPTDLRVQ